MHTPITPDQQDAIDSALYLGRKIEAIKQYRAFANVSLKDAKDYVDELEKVLRAEHPERFATPTREKGGCFVTSTRLLIFLPAAAILVLKLMH